VPDAAAWTSPLLVDLARRDLVHDATDPAALEARLGAGPTSLYCGFDPTADSLHVGNLQQILLLRRFQLAGHRPIALAGGATGMVGDPGGRATERPLLDLDQLDANLAAITAQLGRFLDFETGPAQARLVDNRTWTQPMGVLEFLRDVGKHVTVNTMLAKDSVRTRIERADGISFTEFSYMLLQANDYYVLHRDEGCELQVAGSDQCGNITAGIDLIRRRSGAAVHGLTSPLLVRSDGQKFGKSVDGALWLDRTKTSPYQLFQYFVQVDDADVEPMLLRLTLLSVDEIAAVVVEHAADAARRVGQRRLAREVVAVVHGPEVLGPIEEASALLFGGDPLAAGPDAFELLAHEVPTSTVDEGALGDLVGLFAATGLAKSKGEVRRNKAGYYLNGLAIGDREAVARDELLHGRYALLRRGRRDHHLVQISG
jgi:tyrosyl-tRNA synthetase